MWITPTEAYPVNPLLAPIGQTLVIEPQTVKRDVAERMSIQRITGIASYQQRGPLSTLHWIAKK